MTEERGTLSRRSLVRGIIGLAAASLGGSACTPVRFLLRPTAPDLRADPDRADAVLRAFVETVVPGCESERPEAIRALADPQFPFAPYRGFFASDLCSRAVSVCGDRRFNLLPAEERTRVVARGLEAGGLTTRLYTAAVFLTQIAVLAGIYDDLRGAPLLKFEGAYRFRGLAAISYPEPGRFLPDPVTAAGNYH